MTIEGKVEINFAGRRGTVLLNGVNVTECCGADIEIRPRELVKVNLRLCINGFEGRVDGAQVTATIAELDMAIELLEKCGSKDGQDPLLRTLLNVRAGLGAVPRFSRLPASGGEG